MKRQILPMIASVAALLPFSQAKAVELPYSKPTTSTAQPAVTLYGDFKVGQTFTRTVRSRSSKNHVLGLIRLNAPIQSGIPKYTVGQKVTFTIGANGALTAPGFSIPFKRAQVDSDGLRENRYNNANSTKVGIVRKNKLNVPMGLGLSFSKIFLLNGSIARNSVNYHLN